MSPGLRRSDRPIEKAGIAPDAIRRRTVRTDTLRIVAVSPTVMSGSRREARPAAPYCLLPDRRSLTASASRSVDLPVPQSLWSDRSRAFELERWPGETSAAAQEGRWGDVTFDLDFDWPRIDSLLPFSASKVEAPSAAITLVEPEIPDRRRRGGGKWEGAILRAYRIGTTSPIPKPDTNQRRFWGRPLNTCVFVSPAVASFLPPQSLQIRKEYATERAYGQRVGCANSGLCIRSRRAKPAGSPIDDRHP